MELKTLTSETYKALLAEQAELESQVPGKIAAKNEAAAHGDLQENFEYVAACDELNTIYNRLAEITRILSESKVVTEVSTDEIGIGTYFVATIIKNGVASREQLRLVGEVYNLNAVKGPYIYTSVGSPLGAAVFGKKAGDAFAYTVKNDKNFHGATCFINSWIIAYKLFMFRHCKGQVVIRQDFIN